MQVRPLGAEAMLRSAAPPHLPGLRHRRLAFDFAPLPGASAIDDTLECCAFEAVEKSLERVDGPFHQLHVVLGCRKDDVELLVADFEVADAASVDEGLHLAAHRVEVDRRSQYDDIRLNHLRNELGRIILLRTGLSVHAADAAPRTGVDIAVGEENLFHRVTGLDGARHEAVAQRVGVAAPAGA